MGTKTTTDNGPKTTSVPNPRERVPYTLPINWDNPKADKIVFVGVNEYSANIERGRTVYIPRYVAEFLDRQKKDAEEARMNLLRMQEEYASIQKELS